MPVSEHLRELRRRIVWSLIAIGLLAIVGWVKYTPIINWLSLPLCDLSKAQVGANCGILYINGVLGPLDLQLKVTLITGVVLAAPVWIYQSWAFVAPGLHRNEKRKTFLFAIFATPLFLAGAALAYWILPLAIKILIGFTPNSLTNLVRFDDYLDFVLRLILVFGLAFELPVFLVGLNLAGLLSAKSMLARWRLAVFLVFLFTAAFTPTGDPLTMTLLALPLILLYFGAVLFAVVHDRRVARREASFDR